MVSSKEEYGPLIVKLTPKEGDKTLGSLLLSVRLKLTCFKYDEDSFEIAEKFETEL